MIKTFTPDFIIANKGCYKLRQVKKLSFIKKKKINIYDVLKSEIPLKDKYWFLTEVCDFDCNKKYASWKASKKIRDIYKKYYGNWSVGSYGDYDYHWGSTVPSGLLHTESDIIIKELIKFIKTIK